MRTKFILSLLIVIGGCTMWPTPPEPQRSKNLRFVAMDPRGRDFLCPKANGSGDWIYCVATYLPQPCERIGLCWRWGDLVKVETSTGNVFDVINDSIYSYDVNRDKKIAMYSLRNNRCILLYDIDTGDFDTLLSNEPILDIEFLDSATLVVLKDFKDFYKLAIGDTTLEFLFEVKKGADEFDISPSGKFIVTNERRVYDFEGLERGKLSEGWEFSFSSKNDSIIVFASSNYRGYLGIANWVTNEIKYLDSKVAGGSDARFPCFSSDGNKVFFATTGERPVEGLSPPPTYCLWEYCGVK